MQINGEKNASMLEPMYGKKYGSQLNQTFSKYGHSDVMTIVNPIRKHINT